VFQIDVASAVADRPTPSAAGTAGWFTNGDPATGVPGTVVDQDWLNSQQGELLSILTAAGITPDKTSVGQVLASCQKLFSATYLASGSSSVVLPTGLIVQTFATPQVQLGAANTAVAFTVTYPMAFPNKLIFLTARDNGSACIVWNSFVNPGLASSGGYVWSPQAGTSGSLAQGACLAIGY